MAVCGRGWGEVADYGGGVRWCVRWQVVGCEVASWFGVGVVEKS